MLMARQMVGDDQDRRLLQAQGLMDAGYNPSNQASDMFSTGYNPATLAAQGAITGQELSADAKSKALTQMINAEVIAGNLSSKQAQDLLTTVTGSADASGNYTGGLLGSAADWLLGQAGDALSGQQAQDVYNMGLNPIDVATTQSGQDDFVSDLALNETGSGY